MFKGILSQSGPENRAARRLATVVAAASRNGRRDQRETLRQFTQHLQRLRARHARHQEQRDQPRHSHFHHRPHGAEGSFSFTPDAPHARWGASAGFASMSSTAASAAMQKGWSAAQAEALAQEDAAWRARDPLRRYEDGQRNLSDASSPLEGEEEGGGRGRSGPSSSSFASAAPPPLPYGAVDANTGKSVVQQNFDALIHRALLRYGPPLPVEVVMHNNVITAASMSPRQRRAQQQQHAAVQPDGSLGGADDPNAVYMDEVGLKMHEVMSILRKEEPHFSVREHCDGVPLSLLVRNCSYLRAYGGKVNYMRFVRRLPRSAADSEAYGAGGDGGAHRQRQARSSSSSSVAEGDEGDTMVLSLGKYKMREMPSQDGIRQGPQPWRYSYHTR